MTISARLWGTLAVVAFLAGSLALQGATPARAATSWTWSMSNIHGGGTAQVIVTDPANPGFATVGGDSWGVYNTTSAGNDWAPATKGLGIAGQNDPEPGDFFFMGLAYSKKVPGRVYALTGKLANPGVGNFGYVEGDSYAVVSRAINGGESTTSCGDRTQRPRCTGNRVLVDYDAASGVEYIYVATGDGGGVVRSTDGGRTFTAIGLVGMNSAITGMALDPADSSVLYVGTRANNAYKLTGIRQTATTTHLTGAPARIEEMAAIGGSVYAAAYTSGVYKVSNGGATWTRLSVSGLTGTMQWAAIGGAGNTIYAGGATNEAGKSIAKSTDGGATWTWVPGDRSKVGIVPWGTSDPWWLATAFPRVKLGCYDGGCTYESTSIAVDQFNPDVVYSAGRSGVWKSEDGGATWRPSVNHLAGTMHGNLAVGAGGTVDVDDVDWNRITTNDHFDTVAQSATSVSYGTASLSLTQGGHTYKVNLTVPRSITMDGVDIADEYFRAAVVRPRDIGVSADGQYIYIAQDGGGVVVGHAGTPTTTTSTSTSSTTTSSTTTTTTAPSPVLTTDTFSGTLSNKGSKTYGVTANAAGSGSYTLTWSSRRFSVLVYDPNGKLVSQVLNKTSPIKGTFPATTAGRYKVTVRYESAPSRSYSLKVTHP